MKFRLLETSSEHKAKMLFQHPEFLTNIKTFAILTAQNPNKIKSTKKDNIIYNKNLKYNLSYDKDTYQDRYLKTGDTVEDYLGLAHYRYYKVKGNYGSVEDSFLIYNISLEDAKNISKSTHQQSFIFGYNKDNKLYFEFWAKNQKENFVCIDKKDFYIDANNAEDYYTQISKDFKFRIPFSKFEAVTESLLDFYRQRCDECNSYNENLSKLLDECCNDSLTPNGRDISRQTLYSDNYRIWFD